MSESIVIVVEHHEGAVAAINFELLALAEALARIRPLKIRAVLLGADPEALARSFAKASGLWVTAFEHPGLPEYDAELYKTLLMEVLPELEARYILIPQTTQGLDYAPGLAVRLKSGCLTGVEGVGQGDDGPFFTRTAFNGKIVLDLAPTAAIAVLAVQPGAFKAGDVSGRPAGRVTVKHSTAEPKGSRGLGLKQVRQEDSGLAEAEVVVAAGRGVGKRENLILIEQLAALFARSAVAGSRPLCDQNWLEYKRQVGLTGATVAPKLYIACGISGAIQHTVGMQGSGFIVAISTDPNAAIFNIADVCVVEDLTTFIPALIEAHQGI
ncbi:MAG: electron transfer flavoprotein subunit alpha/FixB family protein [Proteobacteria bacterium]|nr:electron transfer flavoprotein subunit alpha/FixB family protein [Pseudomonadota bacterium]